MTRLDANSEPSMEEILASIRKIIAEDPPGSRASPTPPAASLAGDSSFGARGSYFPTLSDPGTESAASAEPALQRTPSLTVEPHGAAASGEPVAKSAAAPMRTETAFPTLSLPDLAQPEKRSEIPSIDEQLSDLLGDVAPAKVADTSKPASSSFKAGDAVQAPEGLVRDAGLGQSATGFAAKRDGYAASAPGSFLNAPASKLVLGGTEKTPNPSTVEERERDPFDFDLGPSPLVGKSSGDEAIDLPTSTVTPASATMPPLTVKASAPSSPALPNLGTLGTVAVGVTTSAVSDSVPDSKSGEKKSEPLPKSEAVAANKDPFAALTSAKPIAAMPVPGAAQAVLKDATAKPVAASAPATAPRSDDKGSGSVPARDVMDFASALKSVGTGGMSVSGAKPEPSFASLATLPPPPPAAAPSSSTASVPASNGNLEVVSPGAALVTHAQAQQRSMEDTVAELLRPMLRAWLAENMPRIVERALVRELNNLPAPSSDQKTAAE